MSHWNFDYHYPYLNSGYYGSNTQNHVDFCYDSYARDGNFFSNTKDAVIVHDLKIEYCQLAFAEVPLSSYADQQLQEPVRYDWFTASTMNYNYGNESRQDEAYDMEPCTSCSSPAENSYEGNEWSLQIADDFSEIDDEVSKRLNTMVRINHVPRINGEIPTVDEATSDHERLIYRLRLFGLIESKVQGDGNCQFRALSDQFYRSTEHHKFVRQQIVNQLESHPEIYAEYVPMAYSEYLEKLTRSGEWGDHVTLQAAADSYGVKIFVITSFKDTCYIEIVPKIQKSKRVIFLSFWAEVHYNSIYPEGDLPTSQSEKKKRWWPFGNKH